jgi:hypothetical protein
MGRKGILLLPVVGIAVLLLAMTPIGSADLISTTAPDWLGKAPTLNVNVAAISSPTTSAEELPGLGHKFELFGVMIDDTDPENATGNSGKSGGGAGGNETISSTMTPTSYALAYRDLGTGVKISALTNQLGLKYYFVAPRTCGGGSPRISLQIDSDGNGTPNFTAHGHVFAPVYTGCPPNVWEYEDLTDNAPRWEITPGGAVPGIPAYPFMPWKQFAAAVTAAFPTHRVLSGYLVDDSCSFMPATCGKAYYDLVTVENRTLEIWQDTVH